MTINNDSISSEDLDYATDESSSDFDDNLTEIDTLDGVSDERKSKNSNKNNLLAKKRIEQLQEERELKKLIEDCYDDWD